MDWRTIDKAAIFNGKDENGNRYLSQFLKDYQETFHPDMINAGCLRCLEDYYQTFIKYLSTMSQTKNSGYKLREKYNGIPLEFGSPVQVSNSNLTDEYAEKLLKDHPAGADLFEAIPEGSDEVTVESLKKDNTREELDAMASSLGIDTTEAKDKTEAAQAILDALNAEADTEE